MEKKPLVGGDPSAKDLEDLHAKMSADVTGSSELTEVKPTVTDDEVDEAGVPFKNRFMESERKRKKMEDRLAALEAKLGGASKEEQDQEELSTGEDQDQTEESVGFDPYAVSLQPQTKGSEDSGDEDRPLTAREASQLMNRTLAIRQNIHLTFQKFPDSRNPNSALRKEVDRRLALKRAAGIPVDNDPLSFYETAAAVYGEQVASGKVRPGARKIDEDSRRASVDSGSGLPTGVPPKRSNSQSDLTDGQKRAIEIFRNLGETKVTEETYKKFRG